MSLLGARACYRTPALVRGDSGATPLQAAAPPPAPLFAASAVSFWFLEPPVHFSSALHPPLQPALISGQLARLAKKRNVSIDNSEK